MPKKKGKGKKGKKGKKKSGKKSSDSSPGPVDPMAPSYVPPPPKPGEQLVKLLTSHPVDEKEIHGVKVSTRILDNLTPQEIRDLRVVFELFDTNDDGFLSPPELRRAMKALGFKVKIEEAKQLANDGSLKGLGMLDFNEFLETACLDAKVKFKKQELQEMIEEADTNGDGLVDRDEFISIIASSFVRFFREYLGVGRALSELALPIARSQIYAEKQNAVQPNTKTELYT
ncbi:CATR-like protein [Mya arenaria]|uniref:CATR-like protein n=1 Tax=Mya arenaria TaxID=6604 RepID=A0ABY7EVK7_MYAAR|nr:CATR-like protein [Mya arenaria]